MKTVNATLILLLFVAMLYAQKPAKQGTLNYLDEKRGFKSLVLGGSIDTYKKDLTESEGDSLSALLRGVKFYEVHDSDLMQVGDIPINKIVIGALQDKLAMILLEVNKPLGKDLFTVFRAAYGGNFNQSNQFIDSFTWRTKNVYLNVDYDGYTGSDSATFIDMLIYDQIKKSEKEASKKAVSDL